MLSDLADLAELSPVVHSSIQGPWCGVEGQHEASAMSKWDIADTCFDDSKKVFGAQKAVKDRGSHNDGGTNRQSALQLGYASIGGVDLDPSRTAR